MRILSALTLCIISTIAMAENPSVLPTPGEDTVSYGGKTAIEFFANRRNQTECRSKLDEARKQFEKDKTAESKTRWVTKFQECGDCFTHSVDKVEVDNPSRPEIWYVTDGSCQAPQVTSAQYENAKKSLFDITLYPRYKAGGFDPMAEFILVDNKTGELLRDVKRIEEKPSYAFAAFQALEILTFWQYMKVDFKDLKVNDAPAFQMTYESIKAPDDFSEPTVSLVQKQAAKLVAQFYITSTGYMRYYNRGDFNGKVPLIEKYGREALAELVWTMHKRFQ